MKRQTWMSGLGLLVVAGLVSAQSVLEMDAKPVAVVDGVPIRQAELDAVVSNFDFLGDQPTDQQLRQARMRAINLLIDNILMRQFLDKTNIPLVPLSEVQRRFAEMDAGLREQTPRRSLAEFCQERKKTVEQFKEEIADHMRWNAYVATQLTQDKLMQVYMKNKGYFEGVKVRASHIVLRLPPRPLDDNDADRLAARQRARTEASAKLEALRNQLRTDPKTDFAELAKTCSQDPRAKSGGDLGWIERRWYEEAFTQAAFALPNGEVSEVVETSYGLHLIKVTERTPGKSSDFNSAREAVREYCAEELRQQILTDQRRAAAGKISIMP